MDRHILSAEQFSTSDLFEIYARANDLRDMQESQSGRRKLLKRHEGKQIVSIFYEASTRTKASFEIAALKLGMSIYETENAGEFSSAAKGETIEDTIRVLNGYGVSAIVIRSKEEGIAYRAAAVSDVPIINAGDGRGEHPTQSLLDIYTIQRAKGKIEDLHIVMGGDLANGRTVRSLAKLLALCGNGNRITFVSAPDFRIGKDIKDYLRKKNVSFVETDDMYGPLKDADVVYWTRTQRERIKGTLADGEPYILDKKALRVMHRNAIIMHPLPRITEIALEVDDDPRAHYFQQAQNGLYVRMALLDLLV